MTILGKVLDKVNPEDIRLHECCSDKPLIILNMRRQKKKNL